MKLWDKADSTKATSNSRFEKFCMGKDAEMDVYLAKADLIGTLAHAKMLSEQNLLPIEEYTQLESVIQELLVHLDKEKIKIDAGIEDIHSQIEFLLTERLGDIGKKIHSGRSRNDQALLDIKLFLKAEIKTIALEVQRIFDKLITLAERNQDIALPGYTHWQVAMPSSFGLWFSAYAEALNDDLAMLQAAYLLSDKNPLGSGAGYGSTFPLNRTRTTALLDMGGLHYNSINAQLSRGKTEKWMAMAIAAIAATLSRFSNDVCIYNSQNFKFISLSNHVSTGSSLMPHKRNPDVFELLRAHFNILQALPNEISLLTTNLPSGYHRDMQLTKERLFPAIDQFKGCLDIILHALDEIQIEKNCIDNPMYAPIYSVERINELVITGIPFRDAYKIVGKEWEAGTLKRSIKNSYTHEGSIGNLCLEEIKKTFLESLSVFI
jgi:argininosuccinate lyase